MFIVNVIFFWLFTTLLSMIYYVVMLNKISARITGARPH